MTTLADDVPGPTDAPAAGESLRWVGLYALLCLVCGLLAGAFWAGVVHLPTYRVLPDGRAVMTERQLAGFFSADAWFVVTAVLVATPLGWLAWRWLRPLGWTVVPVTVAATLVAGIACWLFGTFLGPGALNARLAAAAPGDDVPVPLDLAARSALAVWPFLATLPLLVLASLLADPESPRPIWPWSRRHPDALMGRPDELPALPQTESRVAGQGKLPTPVTAADIDRIEGAGGPARD